MSTEPGGFIPLDDLVIGRRRRRWIVPMVIALLVGCAAPEERVLTKEQDAEFAARCQMGCAVVPAPLMMEILRRLKAAEGIGA